MSLLVSVRLKPHQALSSTQYPHCHKISRNMFSCTSWHHDTHHRMISILKKTHQALSCHPPNVLITEFFGISFHIFRSSKHPIFLQKCEVKNLIRTLSSFQYPLTSSRLQHISSLQTEICLIIGTGSHSELCAFYP